MAHLTPTPVLEPGQDRTMILNMGPQHPSTHGVLRVILEIDGENRGADHAGYRLSPYRHRENLRGQVLSAGGPAYRPYRLPLPLTNNLCYVPGGGKTAGPRNPTQSPVAEGDVERAHAHQFAPGLAGHPCPGHRRDDVFLYCFREREDILRMFEMVSGQRMMTSISASAALRSSRLWDSLTRRAILPPAFLQKSMNTKTC